MKTRTTYVLDRVPGLFNGVAIDLTRVQIDVYGARWTWTGLVNETGVPLMQSSTDTPLPLDEVYATYGPLIPAPAPLTAAAVRAVLLDDAPAELQKWVAETPRPELPRREPGISLPTTGLPDVVDPVAEEPKPAGPVTAVVPAAAVPSPSTFARLLSRIGRGVRR